MKIALMEVRGRPTLGLAYPESPDRYLDLCNLQESVPTDMVALLRLGGDVMERIRRIGSTALVDGSVWQPLADAHLLPVVSRPGKVVCVGLNYADHAKEGGNARPEYPSFFLRGASSLIAHGDALVCPKVSDKLDYEAELAVVIGQRVRHASLERALAAVAGYAASTTARCATINARLRSGRSGRTSTAQVLSVSGS